MVGRIRHPEIAAEFDRVHRAEQRSVVDEQRSDHALLVLDGYRALVRSKDVDDHTSCRDADTLLRLAGYADDHELAHRTATVVPELTAVLAEHIADNDGILAHVYFGDLSRWACEQAPREATAPELVALLELLESAYLAGDEIVRNLSDVSFVEMVRDDATVVRLFGPNLLSRDTEYLPGR